MLLRSLYFYSVVISLFLSKSFISQYWSFNLTHFYSLSLLISYPLWLFTWFIKGIFFVASIFLRIISILPKFLYFPTNGVSDHDIANPSIHCFSISFASTIIYNPSAPSLLLFTEIGSNMLGLYFSQNSCISPISLESSLSSEFFMKSFKS